MWTAALEAYALVVTLFAVALWSHGRLMSHTAEMYREMWRDRVKAMEDHIAFPHVALPPEEKDQ